MFPDWNESKGNSHHRALVTIVVSVCLLHASLASAAIVMEYEAALNIPTGQERSIRPVAVTCDPLTGDVCVTDAQYSRFHVINDHGIEVFRTGGVSGLSSPVDGTLTGNGDFVFIDRNDDRLLTIMQLDFMGEPRAFEPHVPVENWQPRHLTLAANGDIITLDSYQNLLTRHDAKTGSLLWMTTVTGDGSTELQLGRPVEAPDGRIYVPSGILHNVIYFSTDGKRLGTFGEFGSGPGKLVFPVGIAIGPGESILVLDRMRHKVLMFDREHNLLGDFGSMGAGWGQFYHPSAIAATRNGKVYVAQGYDSRVQVFNIRDTKAQ